MIDAVARKRLEYLSESDLDLAIFQQLPLRVRSRLLKEGVVLFTRDEDALYALACYTARAFEHFRHIQRVVDRDRVLAKLDQLDGCLLAPH
jgi:uncharacterized protein